MTEEEWLAATDPGPMMEFLGHRVSERKLRLFAVACCRRVEHLFSDLRSRAAIEAAEKVADKLVVAIDDLARCYRDASDAAARLPAPSSEFAAARAAADAIRYYHPKGVGMLARAAIAAAAAGVTAAVGNQVRERVEQSSLLRDVLGNPSRPVTADPSWLTSTVTAIARGMYESRDFSAMPILADALQDAGCDNDDVLSHCRGTGPHVRGCWVIDLLTGRK